jgi:hypothetical protein
LQENRAQAQRFAVAQQGPTPTEMGREFARRARADRLKPTQFSAAVGGAGQTVTRDAWEIPTQGLTSKSLFVTTAGGIFVGTGDVLVTAPDQHDPAALGEDQLTGLLGDFLASPSAARAKSPTVRGALWAAAIAAGVLVILAWKVILTVAFGLMGLGVLVIALLVWWEDLIG